jgi:hypothetical protein
MHQSKSAGYAEGKEQLDSWRPRKLRTQLSVRTPRDTRISAEKHAHRPKLPDRPLLAANSLNHTPKNSFREVFFFFSWIFSSAGGVLFPAQIFEDQRWRGRAPTRWILFILLSISAHQIEEDWAASSAEFILR